MNDQELRIVVTAKDTASGVIRKVQNELRDSSTAMGSGLDRARQAADGLNTSLTVSSRSAALAGAVAGVTSAAVNALGNATVNTARAAITGAASYEQNRIAFETMLGSADKARQMLVQISQFAKTTPFELPQVVAGTKQLLAYGFAQQELMPTMRKLGDIAAGLGVPFEQLALAYGQVHVKGHLMGQETLQFTNAGVPIIQTLAKVLNKSTDEIYKMEEAGKIGFADVSRAIDSMTGPMGQFGGMMDKQSHTFSGVVSNIKDGFNQMLRSAIGVTAAGDIVAGGLFDRMKRAAEVAMPAIQRAADNVGPAVSGLINVISVLTAAVVHVGETVMHWLTPSLLALWNTITANLAPSLQKLWQLASPVLIPALEILAKVIGGTLYAAIWLAINVLNVVIGVISNFIARINNAIDVIRSVAGVVGSVFGSLAGIVSHAVSGVYNAITQPFREAIDYIRKIPAEVKSSITSLPQKALNLFTGRAVGGAVSAGQSYVVGEDHPELFVPNTQGRIQPSVPQGGDVKNILSGNFYFSTAESVEAFFARIDKTQRLARVGMA